MKLIHLSDLHLGKRVNEYSMLEDQKFILDEILKILDAEKPDGVILAGDIYDKAVPSAEAVALCDDFLTGLAARKLPSFVISGNHDSPERIAFGSRLMDASGIHMSPVYNGRVDPIPLQDAFGTVNLYMLPFVKPAHVRRWYPDAQIESYTDALRTAVEQMQLDPEARNVLITHQFVTGASRSDSEDVSVGGTDNVDGSIFADFDYVALGHIHSPQNCGSERIRYCGTPLKYSFSECRDEKSVTVVELGEKGSLTVRTIPLKPLHDLAELRGSYEALMHRSFYENTTYQEDYTRVILTDEEEIPDAIGKLRTVYHRLMKLDYDNTRTRAEIKIEGADLTQNRSPLELFCDFYELRNNQPMNEVQQDYLRGLIEKIWEDAQ